MEKKLDFENSDFKLAPKLLSLCSAGCNILPENSRNFEYVQMSDQEISPPSDPDPE
jgi:hypothetical protein